MKIKRLNESIEHPYMFQYNCNNSTFGHDFQRYAQELGAKRMYDHTQKGGGLHFYTVPSEDVYNKLKEVAKKRFTVDMFPIRPFDKERFANAKVQEGMTYYPSDNHDRDNSAYNKELKDEEGNHSYVGKKVIHNNRTYTVTGAYDRKDGTIVRCGNMTLKPDEYKLVSEAMTIAYSEDTIKRMISKLEKEIEDYKQLIIDEPEDKDFWQEEMKKCQAEIDDLKSYKPLDESLSEAKLGMENGAVDINKFVFTNYLNPDGQRHPNCRTYRSTLEYMASETERLFSSCLKNYWGDTKPYDQLIIEYTNLNRHHCIRDLVGAGAEEGLKAAKRAIDKRQGELLEKSKEYTMWDFAMKQWVKEDSNKMSNEILTNKNLNESNNTVPIHYDDIEFTHYGTQYDVDRWDEEEVSTDWTYDVSKDDIVTFLIEEHGSELFDDEISDEEMEKYILDNFDDLLDKYLDSIREYFREEATEDAQDKWEPYSEEDYYSDFLQEAGQRYYVTTYRSDSVSGPEEGGYTSYGWMPTHSKYFPSIEDARKEMLARIEADDEIISQDEDRIYVKDSYGDEYVVAVETAAKRGRTEEPPRTWAEAEFDDPIPRTYFDRNGAPLDHNPYAKRKADKQKAALMNDFMSKLATCSTRDEVLDTYSNAPYQVQLDAIAEVAAKLRAIDGNLNEAHYGGAFDIEDNQYFTKEEIDEFGYEIVDTLNTLGYNKFDYNGGYVDGNVLGIQIYWADGEVTVEQIIDMRKIKTPNDLSRKYLGVMVEKAKLELEKMGADFGPHLNGQDYPIDEDFDDEVIHLDLITEPTLKASNVKFSHELAKELDDMFRENNLWVQELHYNPVEDQIEFDINWGDWKHEHLRATWLINDFFENKNSWVKINSWATEEDGSDTYSAHYEIYN